MDCDELIDEMLSCPGGMAEKRRYEGTTGDNLASPDASSGGGHEVTGQSRQQQTAESPQAVPVERPTETAEPAHVERVTRKKDPKKVAAGRAGAAARQKRLLEQL